MPAQAKASYTTHNIEEAFGNKPCFGQAFVLPYLQPFKHRGVCIPGRWLHCQWKVLRRNDVVAVLSEYDAHWEDYYKQVSMFMAFTMRHMHVHASIARTVHAIVQLSLMKCCKVTMRLHIFVTHTHMRKQIPIINHQLCTCMQVAYNVTAVHCHEMAAPDEWLVGMMWQRAMGVAADEGLPNRNAMVMMHGGPSERGGDTPLPTL